MLSPQTAVSNHMHPAVKEKLYEYVVLDITATPVMRQLRQFVQEDLARQEHVMANQVDMAYFPTMMEPGYNLQHKVEEWKKNDASANFFLFL